MGEWKLQDAKNKFSALVDAAIAGEPQHVTRRLASRRLLCCHATLMSAYRRWRIRDSLIS